MPRRLCRAKPDTSPPRADCLTSRRALDPDVGQSASADQATIRCGYCAQDQEHKTPPGCGRDSLSRGCASLARALRDLRLVVLILPVQTIDGAGGLVAAHSLVGEQVDRGLLILGVGLSS